MSDTPEKNTKIADTKRGIKEARIQKQEQEEKKKQTFYTFLGVIGTAIVLGLVLFNQGFFSTTAPAVTVDGVSYTADQVQMYYTDSMYSALMGQLSPDESGTAYDMSTPADEQYYSLTDSITWHDFFVEEAINSLAELHVLSEIAISSGFTLPEEALEQIESTQFQLDTAWIGYTTNKEAYIRAAYGDTMTEALYLDMVTRELYASYYQTALYDSFEFTDEEYETYYEENKDTLDVVTFSQFHFTTTPLELEVTVDAEGISTTADPTEEQEAAFDAEKESLNILTDEVIARLEEGATIEDLQDLYADVASSYTISDVWMSSGLVNNDNYGTWLLEEDRASGDFQKSGSGVGYDATYTVTIFESRDRANEVTSNIRHIYIAASETGEPTEEEWADSEVKAQEILDQWIADGSNLDTFAELALEHSADTGSAEVGGLMENVSTMSGYVDTFANWATDPSRSTGDTGIVQNVGSATQGWHIMYFEDWNKEMWKLSADGTLATEKMTAWQEEQFANFDTRVVKGEGYSDIEMVSLF